jgi:hypothetical protein
LEGPSRFIVEGIGSSAGLFGQLCQLFEEFSCLHVFEQGGTLLTVDGCGALSTSVISKIVNEKDATAYPNPTAGIVHLLGVPSIGPVHVLDGLGRIVLRIDRSGTTDGIDLSALATGPYTLRVGGSTIRVMKD